MAIFGSLFGKKKKRKKRKTKCPVGYFGFINEGYQILDKIEAAVDIDILPQVYKSYIASFKDADNKEFFKYLIKSRHGSNFLKLFNTADEMQLPSSQTISEYVNLDVEAIMDVVKESTDNDEGSQETDLIGDDDPGFNLSTADVDGFTDIFMNVMNIRLKRDDITNIYNKIREGDYNADKFLEWIQEKYPAIDIGDEKIARNITLFYQANRPINKKPGRGDKSDQMLIANASSKYSYLPKAILAGKLNAPEIQFFKDISLKNKRKNPENISTTFIDGIKALKNKIKYISLSEWVNLNINEYIYFNGYLDENDQTRSQKVYINNTDLKKDATLLDVVLKIEDPQFNHNSQDDVQKKINEIVEINGWNIKDPKPDTKVPRNATSNAIKGKTQPVLLYKTNWWSNKYGTYGYKGWKLDLSGLRQLTKSLENSVRGKIGKWKNFTPRIILALKGGDKGELMLAEVSKEVINWVLPKDGVLKVVKELRANYSKTNKNFPTKYIDTFIKLLEDPKYKDLSVWQIWKNMESSLENKIAQAKLQVNSMKGVKKAERKAQFNKLVAPEMIQLKTLRDFLNTIAKDKLKEYMYKEASTGNFDNPVTGVVFNKKSPTERANRPILDQVDMLIDQVIGDNINLYGTQPLFAAIEAIQRHEYMKKIRGNNYLYRDGSLKTFNRLRLNGSKGIVLEGMPSVPVGDTMQPVSRNIIYDQNKVQLYYNGEPINHITDIPGLAESKNIADGGSMSSQSYLEDTAFNAGRNTINENETEMGEVKSVIVDVSENGVDYIEIKHAEFLAVEGLEARVKRKDGKQGEVVFTIRKGLNGKIQIYDKNNDSIDMVSDFDSVKSRSGKYDTGNRPYKSTTIPHTSRRIIIVPKTKSHSSASGPVQVLDSLMYLLGGVAGIKKKKMSSEMAENLPDFINTLTELIYGEVAKNTNLLINASKYPGTLKKLIGYQFSKQNDLRTLIKKSLSAVGFKGVMHWNHLQQIIPYLNNSLLVKSILKGRSFINRQDPNTKHEVVGSTGYMKPDYSNEVKEGHVIVSSGNQTVVKKIREEMGNENTTIEEINQYLEENEVNMLAYRFPIMSIFGLLPRRIQKLTDNSQGSSIIFSPADTYARLIGDHDIDESNFWIIPNDKAAKLKSFIESEGVKQWVEESMGADISGLFKMSEPSLLWGRESIFNSIANSVEGFNTQGLATSTKSLAARISQKISSITFSDGTVVRPKALNDLVVMDYADLNDDALADPNIQKDKDGNYITTLENELILLINAATDHTKHNILTNMWGYDGPMWFTKRLFHVEGGGELTKIQLEMLDRMIKNYVYSAMKNGTGQGKNLNMTELLEEVHSKVSFLDSSGNQQSKVLIDSSKKVKQPKNEKLKISVTDIQFRVENQDQVPMITPEEGLYKTIIDTIKKAFKGKMNTNLFSKNNTIRKNVQDKTKIQTIDFFEENKKDYNISQSAYNDVTKFLTKFLLGTANSKGWYDILGGAKNIDGDFVVERSSDAVNYDEELFALYQIALREIKKLEDKYPGQQIRSLITAKFLMGVGKIQNVNIFTPVDLFDAGAKNKDGDNISVYEEYFSLWDDNWKNKNEIMKESSNKVLSKSKTLQKVICNPGK